MDFVAERQCGESLENIPLEFHLARQSIGSKVLYCDELLNQPNFSSQAELDVGFWFTIPRHNTQSENA